MYKNYNILNLGLVDKILDYYIINNEKLDELESKCFLVFLNSVYDEYKLELMIIKLCYKFLIYEFLNREIIKYNKNLEILNRYIESNIHVKEYSIVSNMQYILNNIKSGLINRNDIVRTIDDYSFFRECDLYKVKVDKYIEKLISNIQ
jgi:hypothetical protein